MPSLLPSPPPHPAHQDRVTSPSHSSVIPGPVPPEHRTPSGDGSDPAPPHPWGGVLLRTQPCHVASGQRPGQAHRGLVVVLQGHGDHVEADDAGDEDVQVVAGAHGVDEQPCGTVGGIVGQPLGLCRGVGRQGESGTDHRGLGPRRRQSTRSARWRGRRKQGGEVPVCPRPWESELGLFPQARAP